MFLLGITYVGYKPLKLVKNNQILTAIDQFSKIWFFKKKILKIFENKIFFSEHKFFSFFFKFFRKNNWKFLKKFFLKIFFGKKKFEKFYEKILCSEKNILFSKIFENCFLENKIFENWSMAVRIWLFFDQLQRLITQICVTQKKHLMPLKDSTHQDLWPAI